MSLSKAKKAIFQAKFGAALLGLLIEVENVIVTEEGVEKSLADVLATLALKTEIPTNNNQLTNGAGYQTAAEVGEAINKKIASVYKPGGSCAFEDLPELKADNEGYVYNITNGFTTTADFLEGAGKKYKAGADVGIVAVKQEGSEEVTYKYNVFANFVDLTGYIEKVSGATAGNLPKLKNDGSIEDSGVAADNVLVKPTTATNGNLAAFDENKQPVDSGVSGTAVSNHLSDTTKHITAEERSAWNGKAKLYVSSTRPADMQSGDIWLQTFDD